MKNKQLMIGVLLAVCLIIPVSAQTLFLKTANQAENAGMGTGGPAVDIKMISSSFPMQVYKLKYVSAKDLNEAVKGLLGEGEGVTVNERINTIMVRATDKTIKRLSELINKMDVPPLQVQVEAKIIELKSGNGDTTNPSVLGMSWKYSKNSNNYIQWLTDTSTTAADSMGLYAQMISGNVNAYLEALEKTIGYDLVASPWITAINHEESSILIGAKYGYTTTFTSQTGTMQNINFLEVGTKLRFIPHINEDGYIVMEVYPSVSEGSITDGLPQENTTETNNKVLVKDGQSIVIGGLTKEYNSEVEIGLPILAHIPLLGNLFKRTEIKAEKRDIMVIITPHIVTPEFLTEMAQKSKEFENKRKTSANRAKLVR